MAPDEVCEHDMLVLVRWQGRTMAAPLAQLTAVDPDESTAEAVGDWHYWVTQGYCLCSGLLLRTVFGVTYFPEK